MARSEGSRPFTVAQSKTDNSVRSPHRSEGTNPKRLEAFRDAQLRLEVCVADDHHRDWRRKHPSGWRCTNALQLR